MSSPLALLGGWRLERIVEDRHAEQSLTVSGTTVLERTDGGDVRWREEGLLRRPGADPLEVSRTLLLVPPVAGSDGPWWVHFADGRPFHPWRPGVDVTHPCARDLYRGRVDLALPGGWRVVWTVGGPAKDYTMWTTCSR